MSTDAANIPLPFVIAWKGGSISLADNTKISRMYDLSDCDYMDGVKAVYAVDEYGELVKIRVGPQERDEDPASENAVIYAYSPVYAGKRRVGTIAWSDH